MFKSEDETNKTSKKIENGTKNKEKLPKCEDNVLEETSTEEDKTSLKSLGFWVSIACSVVFLLQFVLTKIGCDVEVKILIEASSVVLTFLVGLGVIKKGKGSKSLKETKKEIEDEIEKNLK